MQFPPVYITIQRKIILNLLCMLTGLDILLKLMNNFSVKWCVCVRYNSYDMLDYKSVKIQGRIQEINTPGDESY